ncbi:hypothetical protein [Sandaracinus amylolyticus]|uniref:Uncharacterized protein n=1 Tax=Sandaracinus amylolyticus TaxID=927083 RepID=A0A0F6YIU5_9BACT|nr:hypothetical protein [Sandaracinus amylolyticus]AKF06576.1 hypothetical protein DB32_003725 [Sandaracinus amylolyticus]
MQMPTPDLSSSRLDPLGRFHLAALRRAGAAFADLVASFEPVHAALVAAAAVRASAELGMIEPRVLVRFAEREVELELRALRSAAEALDRGRGGEIASALFPSGLAAEVTPRAAAQSAAARRVLQRLTAFGAAEPLRTEHLPRLTNALASLDAALAARATAAEAFGQAYANELATRDDFCRAYDVSASVVRQRFPRDREQQDLFFDTLRAPRRGRDEDDDAGDRPPPAAE